MTKLVGFVGIESYDLILYLAMALQHSGLRVALIDVSHDRSLEAAMPCEEGIDFYGSTLPETDDCDYTIIYFGRNKKSIDLCDDLFLVTDYQKHNIGFLKNIQLGEDVYPFVVMRDRISSKITMDYIKHELQGLAVEDDAFLQLEDTQVDLERKVIMQYGTPVGMKGLSQSIDNFIVAALKPDFPENEVRAILKRLRRGGR